MPNQPARRSWEQAVTGDRLLTRRVNRRSLFRWSAVAAAAGIALTQAGPRLALAGPRRQNLRDMPPHRFSIGNVEVLALSDYTGLAPVPLEVLFIGVPAEAWDLYRSLYPNLFSGGYILQNGGCYFLRSEGKLMVVETGIGPAGMPMADFLKADGRLPGEMKATGVKPEDVDLVINTCMHPDHTGWNVHEVDGAPVLTFPRARYLVDEVEWAAFQLPEVEATIPFKFMDRMVKPLGELGGLELTSGDVRVTSEVTIVQSPGHTPGNRYINIASGGERAVIWGDQFIHPAQIAEPDWNIIFDLDLEATPVARRALIEEFSTGSISSIACHFEHPGRGQIVRLGDRRFWQGTDAFGVPSVPGSESARQNASPFSCQLN